MHRTHGMTSGGAASPEYRSWANMISRTTNRKNAKFKYYGGRGIGVCNEWMKFEGFLKDMGVKPTPSSTLERKNTNLSYFPDNCVWADWKTQQNNKRNNLRITWNGVTKTATQWEDELGWPHHILSKRITCRHWSVTKAMTITPKLKPRPK
jgi:hypothetical protein